MVKASLIIPTYNRCGILPILLNSICIQQTAYEFEVIIIDNGSNDETEKICKSYLTKIKNLYYIYNKEPGLLTGRHTGLRNSKSEILCFLDDDVELNSNYVDSLVGLFNADNTVNFATGPCLPEFEINPPDWLSYFWEQVPEGKYCGWLSLLDFGKKMKTISPNYVWGLNFCCKKTTMLQLGGFNPDCVPEHLQQFQGDGETGLTQKAINSGIDAVYHPGLELRHYVSQERLTTEYFKKRAFYQGVCDSFSKLRNDHFAQNRSKPTKFKLLRNKLHPYYRWIKKIYIKDHTDTLPKSIKKLKNELTKSVGEGYIFHQNSFNSDEKVKAWVLKENYWNFKIPVDV